MWSVRFFDERRKNENDTDMAMAWGDIVRAILKIENSVSKKQNARMPVCFLAGGVRGEGTHGREAQCGYVGCTKFSLDRMCHM